MTATLTRLELLAQLPPAAARPSRTFKHQGAAKVGQATAKRVILACDDLFDGGAHWQAAAVTVRGDVLVGEAFVGPARQRDAERAAGDLAARHLGSAAVVVCRGDVKLYCGRVGERRNLAALWIADAADQRRAERRPAIDSLTGR